MPETVGLMAMLEGAPRGLSVLLVAGQLYHCVAPFFLHGDSCGSALPGEEEQRAGVVMNDIACAIPAHDESALERAVGVNSNGRWMTSCRIENSEITGQNLDRCYGKILPRGISTDDPAPHEQFLVTMGVGQPQAGAGERV